ncbi:hypothetical protein C8R43DRAFT_988348 [Mycena crocata]|nr:hypothetical protein C8R43DRAFT_988348 [Mycena crocata]
MDLINFYAQYGPKIPLVDGAASQKMTPDSKPQEKSAPPAQSAVSTNNTPVSNGHSAHKPSAPESDIEEDDTKEIPENELILLVRQLRSPTQYAIRPQTIRFNETHNIECGQCIGQNAECKIKFDNGRCQRCREQKQPCSRTEVFNQWVIRHRFNLSWKKAETVLKHGQHLLRSSPQVARVEAESPTPGPGVEVRTSPRTPVPRVRLAPTGIADDPPSRSRSRPQKRHVLGPPHADRKRRKLLTPEPKLEPQPELMLEPESPESSAGREILAAPPSEREPSAREKKSKAVREKKKQVTARDERRAMPNAKPRALLSARVTATESRLDAIENQLRMRSDQTRQRVVAELDGVIGQLEGTGDVQGATARLRALHSSFLEEEEEDGPHLTLETSESWGQSENLLNGDEGEQLLEEVQDEALEEMQDEQLANGEDYIVVNGGLMVDFDLIENGDEVLPNEETNAVLEDANTLLEDGSAALEVGNTILEDANVILEDDTVFPEGLPPAASDNTMEPVAST